MPRRPPSPPTARARAHFRTALLALGLVLAPCGESVAQFHSAARSVTAADTTREFPGEGQIRLRWRNGDELSGKILDSGEDGEGRLLFEGGPFADPFDLDPAHLEGIVFGPSPERPASTRPSFELVLKNGDRLRGELLAIDGLHLAFLCEPLGGAVEIGLSDIVRLNRIASAGGAVSGLSGLGELDDWISTGRDRKPTDWKLDLGGELSTHKWMGNLFREIDLPEKVEVRFRALFPAGSPKIEVGLLREPQRGPMVETWGEHLVLTHQSRFAPAMTLDESTVELHLRLFWDQSSGRTLLCDPAGNPLASIEGETEAEPTDPGRRSRDPLRRGFSILSRNPEMRFVSLEVREWDGGPVPLIDLTRPRLRLHDRAVRFDTEGLSLESGADRLSLDGESFPLEDLVEWILLPDASEVRPGAAPATRIAWETGTSISGAFLGIDPASLKIQPPWTGSPVAASLAGARELRFADGAAVPRTGRDTLAIDDKLSLLGTLRLSDGSLDIGTDSGSGLLAWQPPGAASPSAFASGCALSVVRSPLPAGDAEAPVALGQARLYLETDEILVGSLVSFSEDTVVFESRTTGQVDVPAARVRAVDIGTAGRVLEGFRDPEWEINEDKPGEVVIEPDTATMKSGSFGNPSLLLGDRIRFDAEWRESYGAMTMRLFAAGPDSGSPSIDIIVAAQGNRLFVGRVNENGAFSFSGDQIPIVKNRASIDISARPEEIEVRVNGKTALTMKPEPGKAAGNGIYFKMGGGWQGWNQADSLISLSGFRIESSPGGVPRRVIDPRAKRQSLAVPRSMRETIPTHLLIAPNGDLLRGSLSSIDERSVTFHANGETLDIPRPRVSSIVRLVPPPGHFFYSSC